MWHPEYRLPLTTIQARTGLDPRRPELALDTLVELGVLREGDVLTPERIGWADLARVHSPAWLDAITQPEALASVFSVEPWDIPPDALVDGLRRACGGTLLAAETAVVHGGPVLNLCGGFHHAMPDRGGGFCALNDVAVALAVLRGGGFSGAVAVLDLDAHPPDGIAACVPDDVWIGSITGSGWTSPPRVDEEVVGTGADDGTYLAALDRLLDRLPRAALTFVIAGGDVREGDPLGRLGVSEAGVRRRDQRALDAIAGASSVWLPGGGYRTAAWRTLAGTALVLAGQADVAIAPGFDPLRARFRRIGAALPQEITLDDGDLDELLGPRREQAIRLLGVYTRSAVELALERYGLSEPIRRLGYRDLRAELDHAELGDRLRLYGSAGIAEHLLAESVLARSVIGADPVLFVHWLTLRHPLGAFRAGRPPLPGQEVPGLGLMREVGELHRRVAARLGLAGVAMRPAWLHVAFAVRNEMRCVDPVEQGRFEALLRDAGSLALPALSQLAHDGALTLNDEPYTWSAPLVVEWLVPRAGDAVTVAAAREQSRFAVPPTACSQAPGG